MNKTDYRALLVNLTKAVESKAAAVNKRENFISPLMEEALDVAKKAIDSEEEWLPDSVKEHRVAQKELPDVADLTAERDQLQSQIADLTNKLTNAAELLAGKIVTINQLRKQLDEAQITADRHKDQLAITLGVWPRIEESESEPADGLGSRIAELEESRSLIRANRDGFVDLVDQLKAENAQLRQAIEAGEQDKATLQRQLDEARREEQPISTLSALEQKAWGFGWDMASWGTSMQTLIAEAPDEYKSDPLAWAAYLRGCKEGGQDAYERQHDDFTGNTLDGNGEGK